VINNALCSSATAARAIDQRHQRRDGHKWRHAGLQSFRQRSLHAEHHRRRNVVKNGANKLTLTGVNASTGTTYLNQGTLVINTRRHWLVRGWVSSRERRIPLTTKYGHGQSDPSKLDPVGGPLGSFHRREQQLKRPPNMTPARQSSSMANDTRSATRLHRYTSAGRSSIAWQEF